MRTIINFSRKIIESPQLSRMHTQQLPEKYKKFTKINDAGFIEWNLGQFDVNTNISFGRYHVECGVLKEMDPNKCGKIQNKADISTGVYYTTDSKNVYRLCFFSNYLSKRPLFDPLFKCNYTFEGVDIELSLYDVKSEGRALPGDLITEYTMFYGDRSFEFTKIIERIDCYHPRLIARVDGECYVCNDEHGQGEDCWGSRYVSQIFTTFYFKKYCIIQHIGLPNNLPNDISNLLLDTFMIVCMNYNYTDDKLLSA